MQFSNHFFHQAIKVIGEFSSFYYVFCFAINVGKRVVKKPYVELELISMNRALFAGGA